MKPILNIVFASVIFCLLFVACTNSSEEIQEENKISQNLQAHYGNENYVFPPLSENSKTYASNWAVFDDFQLEAKSVNGTIEGLKVKSERLVARLDSLTKKIPDTLFTQPIYSRVMVAKTRASMLFQEVRKSRIDSLKLQASIYEMNDATKNLILVINEKFAKDQTDFQLRDNQKKEIEKQKRFLDSIYKAELQDNKKK